MRKNAAAKNRKEKIVIQKGAIKRLVGYLRPHRARLAVLIFFALLTSACGLAAPYIIGKAIDFIKLKDAAQVMLCVISLCVIFPVAGLSQWLLTESAVSLSQRIVKDLREQLFQKFLKLPLKTLDIMHAGDLTSRFVSDAETAAEGIFQALGQLFSGIFTIIGCTVIMLIIDYAIAIVIVIVAPLALIIAAFVTKNTRRIFRQQQAELGLYNAYIDEMIAGQKVVRAFNREGKMAAESEGYNKKLYAVGQKAMFFSSIVNPTTRFVNNIAYVMVGLIGGIGAAAGGLSVGLISSLISYSAQFAKPLNELTAVSTQLQAAFAAAGRIFELFDMESEPDESGKTDMLTLSGDVEFRNVCFSYSPDKKLIENFNLKVKAGQTAAIVGRTGAGKTTLVNLIMRFYEVDSGQILVGGVPINTVRRESVRAAFGMVLQDSFLFSGTIADNIKYGMPEAGFEQVVAAAKSAHAYGFISRTEKGFDTLISSEGGAVSQGQKQLLTIARATIKNPPMLILDEATSSVDTRTERRIQKGLNEIRQGKTSFIIAHRLSTIENADIIIVMENGSIAESGTHAELLEKGGVYAGMYNAD